MKPLTNHGIKCMSMGFLVRSEDALIWRGLMVMQAMQRLLRQVNWGSLDYLLVDMPPGTGDVQLSVLQNVRVSGALVVSTPQSIALQDARKSIVMYQKVGCKVLGLVQNMHGYTCSGCGTRNYIFGKDGAANLSRQLQISLLGNYSRSFHAPFFVL
jgi:ATP-binding protein involved in chromosome partitioning